MCMHARIYEYMCKRGREGGRERGGGSVGVMVGGSIETETKEKKKNNATLNVSHPGLISVERLKSTFDDGGSNPKSSSPFMGI